MIPQQKKHPGPFLALEATTENISVAQAAWSLSPEVMQFSESVWLVDLGATWSYWKHRAVGQHKGLAWLWRQLLERHFQSDATQLFGSDPGYRGAIAPHPWAALLLLNSQAQHQVAGLCTFEGKRGQRFWNRCSWNTWEATHRAAGGPFKQTLPKFDPGGFNRAVGRFAKTAQRLGFERPSFARSLPAQGVQNRYGLLLSQLWSHSFGAGPSQTDPFVWTSAQPSPPPSLHRVLDDSPVLWEQVEPSLKPDFDQLSKIAGTKQVLQMDWCLFLTEGEPVHLQLDFRHPHHLGSEQGHQQTALARSQLAFEAARSQGLHRLDREEEYCELPPVVGWDLTLTQCIDEPDLMLDLFGGLAEQGSGLDSLRRLENQLPIPLHRYQLHWDWQPENSYAEAGEFSDQEATAFAPGLLETAKNRPLLVRQQPARLEQPPRQLEFCESTSGHWWAASGDVNREYYRSNARGRSVWVFQNAQGQWYEQGLFS